LNGANGQAEPHIERRHPLHIASGQVIVDCDDVHAATLKRIEIRWQRRDQSFTFTSDHFSDSAAVQDHAANHLNVVVTHLKETLATFSTNGKRFNQNVVSRFAVGQSVLELFGLSHKFVVRHRLIFAFELRDGIDFGLKLFDLPRVGRTK